LLLFVIFYYFNLFFPPPPPPPPGGVSLRKILKFQFHLPGNKFFTSNFSATYEGHQVNNEESPVLFLLVVQLCARWVSQLEAGCKGRNTVIQAVCAISCTRVTISLSSAASPSTLTAAASASTHSLVEKRDSPSEHFKYSL
jgi:hypothetical protein